MYLKLANITLSYGLKKALNNINLEINKGDFIFILGPNGGGKSSLIKVLTKLLKPISGEVINNETNIGYLPQSLKIKSNFPASVKEVIYSGVKNRYLIKKKGQLKRIDELLQLINFSDSKNKLINELSGGELQRVLFARAIINNPSLLILDEPTSAMDLNFRVLLYDYLDKLNKAGTTIIIITHELSGIDYVKCQNKILYIDKEIKFFGSFCDYEQNILNKEHHHV